MSAALASLLGFRVTDTRPLADRSDEDLVLIAGYSSASVRQFRKALALGMSEADAEELLQKEAGAMPTAKASVDPLPATPAHVLLALGFTRESVASYRLAVLLGANPVDAEDLLVMTSEEARLAA